MKRRLIAALVPAALIIVSVAGCHAHVTVHGGPALHGSVTGR